jgi:hypothetical protein
VLYLWTYLITVTNSAVELIIVFLGLARDVGVYVPDAPVALFHGEWVAVVGKHHKVEMIIYRHGPVLDVEV